MSFKKTIYLIFHDLCNGAIIIDIGPNFGGENGILKNVLINMRPYK